MKYIFVGRKGDLVIKLEGRKLYYFYNNNVNVNF